MTLSRSLSGISEMLECDVSYYRAHPGLDSGSVAQLIQRREYHYERIMQKVVGYFTVFDIMKTYPEQFAGVCRL